MERTREAAGRTFTEDRPGIWRWEGGGLLVEIVDPFVRARFRWDKWWLVDGKWEHACDEAESFESAVEAAFTKDNQGDDDDEHAAVEGPGGEGQGVD